MTPHDSSGACGRSGGDRRRIDTGGGDTVAVRIHRPFLFLIRDRATGLILFVGVVTDPQA